MRSLGSGPRCGLRRPLPGDLPRPRDARSRPRTQMPREANNAAKPQRGAKRGQRQVPRGQPKRGPQRGPKEDCRRGRSGADAWEIEGWPVSAAARARSGHPKVSSEELRAVIDACGAGGAPPLPRLRGLLRGALLRPDALLADDATRLLGRLARRRSVNLSGEGEAFAESVLRRALSWRCRGRWRGQLQDDDVGKHSDLHDVDMYLMCWKACRHNLATSVVLAEDLANIAPVVMTHLVVQLPRLLRPGIPFSSSRGRGTRRALAWGSSTNPHSVRTCPACMYSRIHRSSSLQAASRRATPLEVQHQLREMRTSAGVAAQTHNSWLRLGASSGRYL